MGEAWFTVEKIDDDTFVISEYFHWEETHCYLLCGTNSAVLIDTGLGVSNIQSVARSLTRLPIAVITTHVHWDHIGGHRYFQDIAVHEAEKNYLTGGFPLPLAAVKRELLSKPCSFPRDFSIDRYEIFQGKPTRILCDGDHIDLGCRKLEVIHTPGHSPGHCCFYEPERKYLFSGDLIYSGCLDAFYPTTDPLKFWQSVRKILLLDIVRIFPGHHTLLVPTDIISRIEAGFRQLANTGNLVQGKGVFDFGDFQIHI